SVSAYGDGLELASGPGAMLEVHTRGRRFDYGGTLTGEYRLPSTVERGGAVVGFSGGAVHAMASGSYALAPRHHLLFAAGGGLEIVRVQGSSSELANVRFVDGTTDPIPTARALARYSYATPVLRLFAGLGVDAPLRNPRYLLSRGGDSVVLFEPWDLRPFVMLGLETN
ncbi:MAG: hypothetical protein KF764_34110, partial [Labilithrix sp.]|nr:hypothetical protein [Labilithrix sp.]